MEISTKRRSTMRMKCSRSEYEGLSWSEKEAMTTDLLALIKKKYPDSEFGYNSFPELEYDEAGMILSTIFLTLKNSGLIICTGYEEFRLRK